MAAAQSRRFVLSLSSESSSGDANGSRRGGSGCGSGSSSDEETPPWARSDDLSDDGRSWPTPPQGLLAPLGKSRVDHLARGKEAVARRRASLGARPPEAALLGRDGGSEAGSAPGGESPLQRRQRRRASTSSSIARMAALSLRVEDLVAEAEAVALKGEADRLARATAGVTGGGSGGGRQDGDGESSGSDRGGGSMFGAGVGAAVRVAGVGVGRIRYVGPTEFADGNWIGVQLGTLVWCCVALCCVSCLASYVELCTHTMSPHVIAFLFVNSPPAVLWQRGRLESTTGRLRALPTLCVARGTACLCAPNASPC